MITKNCLIVPSAALAFTFSTEIALAAENNDAGFLVTAWPLVVLSIVLIVFRKQLIIQATPEQQDSEHHETPTQSKKAVEPSTKPAPATPTSTANINLKDGNGQCQASTTKGTRCKRTSSLEDASVNIDGKTYELTVCKQHHNDALQPFSELMP